MLALSICIVIMAVITVDTLRLGISPMPTLSHEKKKVLSLIDPDFSGTIVDLGSGFGTMVRALKKHAPKATVIGIEKAFIPYIISKILLTPHIRYGDFTSSFPQGDLFYAYLYPGGMDKLPRDIPLISLAFAQRQRKPEKVLEVGVLQPTKIYVYK